MAGFPGVPGSGGGGDYGQWSAGSRPNLSNEQRGLIAYAMDELDRTGSPYDANGISISSGVDSRLVEQYLREEAIRQPQTGASGQGAASGWQAGDAGPGPNVSNEQRGLIAYAMDELDRSGSAYDVNGISISSGVDSGLVEQYLREEAIRQPQTGASGQGDASEWQAGGQGQGFAPSADPSPGPGWEPSGSGAGQTHVSPGRNMASPRRL